MRTTLFLTVAVVAALRAADSAGRYTLRNGPEMASQLVLKPDGRFEFMLVYGAADYWSKGSWKRENGAVVLNTDAGDEKAPVRLAGSSAGNRDRLRVTVAGPQSRPVPNIDVVVEGDGGPVEARTGPDGVAEFPPVARVRSAAVRIRVYDFQSEPVALNPEHRDFRLEIDGAGIAKVRFRDERLEVSGNALMLRYGSAARPLRYERE
jgi:hypothetical protein